MGSDEKQKFENGGNEKKSLEMGSDEKQKSENGGGLKNTRKYGVQQD